jgi:hypothetical protein
MKTVRLLGWSALLLVVGIVLTLYLYYTYYNGFLTDLPKLNRIQSSLSLVAVVTGILSLTAAILSAIQVVKGTPVSKLIVTLALGVIGIAVSGWAIFRSNDLNHTKILTLHNKSSHPITNIKIYGVGDDNVVPQINRNAGANVWIKLQYADTLRLSYEMNGESYKVNLGFRAPEVGGHLSSYVFNNFDN